MNKLKECPFCGGTAKVFQEEWREVFSVLCMSDNGKRCTARIVNCYSENEAIEQWNTRHNPGYETPEQYFKRTGEKWRDDAPVWYIWGKQEEWEITLFGKLLKDRQMYVPTLFVVVATNAGKPPKDWRPE